MSEVMQVSLWCAGELLGEANLSSVTGLPLRGRALSGPFLPGAGFSRVWPIFDEWNRAGIPIVAAAQRSADAAPEQFREVLRATMPQPAVAALEGAAAAASALPLELRDGAGSAVPHAWVQVSEWNLFSALPDPDARRDAEAAAAREGFPTRGYVLVVTGIAPKVHGAAEEPPD